MDVPSYGIQLLLQDDTSNSSRSSSSASCGAIKQRKIKQTNRKDSASSTSSRNSTTTTAKRTTTTNNRQQHHGDRQREQRNHRTRGESFATNFDVMDDYNSDDDDAQFVLQYSTVNGRRMRKDEIIGEFAMKAVLADNPVLTWTTKRFSPTTTRMLTIAILAATFLLPAIWNVSVAYLSYDSILKKEAANDDDDDGSAKKMMMMMVLMMTSSAFPSFDEQQSNSSTIMTLRNLNASSFLSFEENYQPLCFNTSILNEVDNGSDRGSNLVAPAFTFNDALPPQQTNTYIPLCYKSRASFPQELFQRIQLAILSLPPMPNATISKASTGGFPFSPSNRSASLTPSSSSSSSFSPSISFSELTWNPYVFAIFCNLSFAFLAIVTYHRLELRRRVSAHLLSYGAICVNRWTWKRVAASAVFTVCLFFACFSTFAVVFGWKYTNYFSNNNNNNNNNSNDRNSTDGGISVGNSTTEADLFIVSFPTAAANVAPIVLGNVVVEFTQFSTSTNSSSSVFYNSSFLIGDTAFFWKQHPRVQEVLEALREQSRLLKNQAASAASSLISASRQIDGDERAAATETAAAGSPYLFTATFMFFVSSLFGALVPYLIVLSMLWSRMTTPTILDQLFFVYLPNPNNNNNNSQQNKNNQHRNKPSRGQQQRTSITTPLPATRDPLCFSLSMMRYLTGRDQAKFRCDLDTILKAIRLVSFTTPRPPPSSSSSCASSTTMMKVQQHLGDVEGSDEDDDEGGNNKHDEKKKRIEKRGGLRSSESAVSPYEAPPYDLLGQGFLISPILAMHFLAGWTTPWRLRRTSEAHPHELLFGTTWGGNDEEVNAVLSVMFEHNCLTFLNSELEDDIHWNKPEIVTLDQGQEQDVVRRQVEISATPVCQTVSDHNNNNDQENDETSGTPPSSRTSSVTNSDHHRFFDQHRQVELQVGRASSHSCYNTNINDDNNDSSDEEEEEADDETHHEILL